MESKTILFICAAFLLAATALARDYQIGDTSNSVLVYSEIHEKPPKPFADPFAEVEEVVIVEVTDNGVVKAVKVRDFQGDGTVAMDSENIGKKEVAILLAGRASKGYKFQIDVYAEYN